MPDPSPLSMLALFPSRQTDAHKPLQNIFGEFVTCPTCRGMGQIAKPLVVPDYCDACHAPKPERVLPSFWFCHECRALIMHTEAGQMSERTRTKEEIMSEGPDARGFTWRECKCGQLHMAHKDEQNTLCPWCREDREG